MANQPRAARILVSLIVAMTVTAAVLMFLDGNSISAGAFSLASYSALGPISNAVATKAPSSADRWDKIEVFYSNTDGGNLFQLASLNGLSSSDDVNFHFLVCNQLGAIDGQIQPSLKWQNQWSALKGGSWYGSSKTIRICVIARVQSKPSDYQINRTAELIGSLSRKFNIGPGRIVYPKNWNL